MRKGKRVIGIANLCRLVRKVFYEEVTLSRDIKEIWNKTNGYQAKESSRKRK